MIYRLVDTSANIQLVSSLMFRLFVSPLSGYLVPPMPDPFGYSAMLN